MDTHCIAIIPKLAQGIDRQRQKKRGPIEPLIHPLKSYENPDLLKDAAY